MKIKILLLFAFNLVLFNESFAQERSAIVKDTSLKNYDYSSGKLIHGKKNGPWIYLKNQKIVRTSYFKDDTVIGITLIFYPNGVPKRIIPFENGTISGLVKFYSPEGDQIAVFFYSEGEYVKTVMRNITHGVAPWGQGYHPLEEY